MLPDYFGSPEDREAAMRYDPPAPPKRPFVVCRRCLRDDVDKNQAACLCCGGEVLRYAEAETIEQSDLPVTCEFCERRPAVMLTGDGRPICRVCDENANEDAWVRGNEESQ